MNKSYLITTNLAKTKTCENHVHPEGSASQLRRPQTKSDAKPPQANSAKRGHKTKGATHIQNY